MNKMDGAVKEIYHMDELSAQNTWLNQLHPLIKLLVTFLFIMITVSCSRYQLSRVLLLSVYPVVLFIIGDISFADSLRRLRIVLPLVCLAGIVNPFFDRQPIASIRGFVITAGMLSMITLILKGVLCVLSSYLLIASTSIESICYALRLLHIPAILVTQILLTYRYISLLLTEAGKMMDAYSLRAPGQRGIHIKAWGSLVGGLLLRSMDRASALYESMVMRGYAGEFYYGQKKRLRTQDMIYLLLWIVVFAAIKYC
ncbi:MAG: cobalt ECF transporter T component CbiQ [Dorea sp.]